MSETQTGFLFLAGRAQRRGEGDPAVGRPDPGDPHSEALTGHVTPAAEALETRERVRGQRSPPVPLLIPPGAGGEPGSADPSSSSELPGDAAP